MSRSNIRLVASLPWVMAWRKRFESWIWKHRLIDLKVSQRPGVKEKKFLIATTIGGNLNTLAFDLVLGQALKSRGHKVVYVLCGGNFSACMYAELNKFYNIEEFLEFGSKPLCNECSMNGNRFLSLTNDSIIELFPKFTVNQLSEKQIEIAESGAKRFLAVGRIQDEKEYLAVLKRYSNATKEYVGSIDKVLSEEKFDAVIAHHGIYVPQGIFQSSSKDLNTPFVSWAQGYRKGTYIFSRKDTYHKELLEPFPIARALTSSEQKIISDYLESRDLGKSDWIHFGITSKSKSKNLNIDFSKSTAVLLTNVSWDAQLHYDSRIFKDMHEWILETIEWFTKRPNLNLVIRIHPAEVTGRIQSRDPVKAFISKSFPTLPPNIKIIAPLDKVSTYSILDKANLAIIFGTKTGLEVASSGIPLLIAGEAWSRGKGIGIEPTNKEEYYEALQKFAKNHEDLPRDKARAQAVAYHYFFERLFPIDSIQPINYYPYARPRIKDDWYTKDYGLRRLVECLENETPFILNS
jgi:hypothetical protein